ncbi:hypothetical protein [Mucilaginibacter agri]|uniref:Uncharacterized protein n=1 Tax=Mucilaginibacter agri TaxID=2695265 RepID=A0A966DVQ5_9SPHI|nr:hypothetical protein [Mucilaginibacter agri]NCD71692.1 hypothetical protein [Mucilaginibacter agri]
MLKGVYISLMIGPAIPVVAPKVVIDSLSAIQVTNSKDRNGFQLTFNLAKNSPLLVSMLPGGFFDPIVTRVIIVVTINGTPNVLMDGFITSQDLAPANEPGRSNLTVTGEDVSLAMDLVQIIAPFPAMPDVAKIYLLLAPFAFLGVVPLVIPPEISPIRTPTEGWDSIVRQTNRQCLKDLAANCGYIFYIQPGPVPGQSIAYFGPDVNLPIVQPALSINMDAHSNVESLSFSLNGLAKKIRIYTIFDPITEKITVPIPVPNFNVLKPPLGARPQPILQTEFADSFSKFSPALAAQKVIGDAINSDLNPPGITGNGSFDILRYNRILQARMMIGVRGAGLAYDGLYYVDSVTHNIKPGEYKQNFTLSRDGLISNTPALPV